MVAQMHLNVTLPVHCLRCSTYCRIHRTQYLFLNHADDCHMHGPHRAVFSFSALCRFSLNSPPDVKAQAADHTYPEIFQVGIRALPQVPGDPLHFSPVQYPSHIPSAPWGESLYPTAIKYNCDTSLQNHLNYGTTEHLSFKCTHRRRPSSGL